MTSPLVDFRQREAFLKTAQELGFDPADFGFVGSTTTIADRLVHTAIVSRGNHTRRYPHGGDLRWLGDALKDLYAGLFGAPPDAELWNRPVLIPDEPLKGKWMGDAFFRLRDGSRVEWSDPKRVFDTEEEAFRAGRDWLRNHMNVNR